ncbi:MAG: hypothetical protein NXH97_21375 [Rhodobacteraceae bacterium]|nr:hypothetical protein [Paracoccaceae bacterium]
MEITEINRYPGFELATGPETAFVEPASARLPLGTVDFGTDGGVIAAQGGRPSFVVRAISRVFTGADEHIMLFELLERDAFLARVLDALEVGHPLP